jgi:hypothetical protein
LFPTEKNDVLEQIRAGRRAPWQLLSRVSPINHSDRDCLFHEESSDWCHFQQGLGAAEVGPSSLLPAGLTTMKMSVLFNHKDKCCTRTLGVYHWPLQPAAATAAAAAHAWCGAAPSCKQAYFYNKYTPKIMIIIA